MLRLINQETDFIWIKSSKGNSFIIKERLSKNQFDLTGSKSERFLLDLDLLLLSLFHLLINDPEQ